ncbi:DUF4123 domain-containing protein [Aestuariibius sp. 2305UL40-4]|uniref:DUF4123 domain-containing protein n=1 Tax=Aestuariibius violaceus TaxID=3234132 RepID=UPI00345E0800
MVESERGFRGTILQGEEAEELADVMPCLVQLSPDDPLTQKLFREVPGADASLGTLHLWPGNPALVIRCSLAAEELRRHLRRLLRPVDADGRRKYVRLWNPSIA